jgi:hypothetical protein
VTLHVLDGREPGVWEEVWQAGDIYTLLSDNIQESFGLSPVEAMAAGLPVVGSDWDGLRDTIVHGQTGFRVPTLTPPSGSGEYISAAFDHKRLNYDQYIAAVSQVVSVDVSAAARAYAALIADAGLRRSMGAAAQAHAQAVYDWARIIPEYQALWGELAERRGKDAELAPRQAEQPGNPARADPFRNFAGYPTRGLAMTDHVRAGAEVGAAIARIFGLNGVNPVGGVIATQPEIEVIGARLALAGEMTVAEILVAFRPIPAYRLLRTVAWLHKHGLVEIDPPLDAPRGGLVPS